MPYIARMLAASPIQASTPAPAPIPGQDADRLNTLFALLNPALADLADALHTTPLDLANWLASPPIADHLAAFTAASEALDHLRALAARTPALSAAQALLHTDNPIEQRRILTTLLKAPRPQRPHRQSTPIHHPSTPPPPRQPQFHPPHHLRAVHPLTPPPASAPTTPPIPQPIPLPSPAAHTDPAHAPPSPSSHARSTPPARADHARPTTPEPSHPHPPQHALDELLTLLMAPPTSDPEPSPRPAPIARTTLAHRDLDPPARPGSPTTPARAALQPSAPTLHRRVPASRASALLEVAATHPPPPRPP